MENIHILLNPSHKFLCVKNEYIIMSTIRLKIEVKEKLNEFKIRVGSSTYSGTVNTLLELCKWFMEYMNIAKIEGSSYENFIDRLDAWLYVLTYITLPNPEVAEKSFDLYTEIINDMVKEAGEHKGRESILYRTNRFSLITKYFENINGKKRTENIYRKLKEDNKKGNNEQNETK